MDTRIPGRSTAAAVALLLALSGVAVADSVDADADLLTPSIQSRINLGTVGAGATISLDVGIELACRGTAHVDVGSFVELVPVGIAPADGSISATPTTVGPVPPDWPGNGDPCIGDPVLAATVPSHVTIVAPRIAGTGYVYRLSFTHPPARAISGTTLVQFVLSVSANTPPELVLPGSFTAEGNAPGGWIAAWDATSRDAEDDPDPLVTCLPAPGTLLPLGTTSVRCSATDTGGLTASGSFEVTVVDTTAPSIDPVPHIVLVTGDPGGMAVAFALPAATDAVDPAVDIACAPGSGGVFPVGTTTVTCTAVDDSGNAATSTFTVTLRLASVRWWPPAGDEGLRVTHGRTVPLKAIVRLDGMILGGAFVPAPELIVQRLDGPGGAVVDSLDLGAFTWQEHRWTRLLDTSMLDPGTWRVRLGVGSLLLDGPELSVIERGAGLARGPQGNCRGHHPR